MSITGLKALQISKMADHILHVPGNYRGGNLEMTIVISSRLDVVFLQENIKAVVDALKRSSEVYRNVRLNLVRAKEEGGFENKVVPLIFLQTGKVFEPEEEYGQNMPIAPLSEICLYLKLFHARSKLILIFADENYDLGDKEKLKEAMNPFLKQKLLLLAGEEPITGAKLFMESISGGTTKK